MNEDFMIMYRKEDDCIAVCFLDSDRISEELDLLDDDIADPTKFYANNLSMNRIIVHRCLSGPLEVDWKTPFSFDLSTLLDFNGIKTTYEFIKAIDNKSNNINTFYNYLVQCINKTIPN